MLSAEPKTTSNTDQLPDISSSLQNRRSFFMLYLTCPFLLHAKVEFNLKIESSCTMSQIPDVKPRVLSISVTVASGLSILGTFGLNITLRHARFRG